MSSVALTKLIQDNDDVVAVQRDSLDWAFVSKKCQRDPNHKSCGGGGGDDPDDPPVTGLSCAYQGDGDWGEAGWAWGVDRVDADVVRNADNCGEGIDVYVLDSGVDPSHPDLGALASRVDCTKGRGCKRGGNDVYGHGTHVAGTIGARANGFGVIGVAPAVNLHSVKVLGNNGLGFRSNIIKGIEHVMAEAQDKGVPVIANMSLGGDMSDTGTCSSSGYSGPDSYHMAICEAKNVGVIFVVAAGNEGVNTGNVAPAGYDDAVITVSATDQSDNRPSWSNFGSAVDVAAPGVDIRSTVPGGGYSNYEGTSMATPHVAGAVALWLKQNSPDADHSAFADARTAITDTAEAGIIGPSDEGLLDAANLLGLDSSDD